ncbi:7a-methyl-1,5-dioxo-octahydro-1H-inden-4-yl [Seminavis robusta]|uniref:7a-methyl-1,5-dioxo-octahydro-1H-inden-4-yl n=1 Tax=Seminavis robusta TaxID=568900 RepID=A0A9N8DLR1_9STRA|nr:7a-methyl-1,5-dioxo-octahydro-1H-inden-4-yl [Seminavis robusta]|eukprot:Sro214_g088780.1 7a-methyl-1,5-dioxo-octahydro-1H-inden-4-yl (623) ;mRNA; r:56149-58119
MRLFLLQLHPCRRLPRQLLLHGRQWSTCGGGQRLFFASASPAAIHWSFPTPPPPPTASELQDQGIPILHQAAKVASADKTRILLSEWKHEQDGTVETVSYSQVLAKSSLFARYILQQQQQEQQRKLVAHLNVPGWEYVATQWGAWAAGYGSVPLALSQTAPEMEHVLTQANPQFIVLGGNCRLSGSNTTGKSIQHPTRQPPNAKALLQAAENLGMTDRVVPFETVVSQKPDVSEKDWMLGNGGVLQSLDEPALVLFTSGTTGKPKAAVITHRNIYHQVTDLVAAWEWQSSDVALHLLPLHHVHGVINLLSCAAFVGARLEFQPFDATALWNQWAQPSSSSVSLPPTNILMAVPTIYAKLLEAADTLPQETVQKAVDNTLSSMRLQVSGSAALPVSVLERWRNLTGQTLLERYGMTEFAMALSNPYREDNTVQQRRPGYVGRPLPSVQVRLVDTDTQEVIETEGVSGELQVKGPTVFQEYLNREDATREAFTKDGYFATGDIAQFDGGEIQSYRILGRASVDIIKSGGHKLSALEIERELLEHPDIAEVAILGIPDDVWGERVAMVCRLKKADSEPLTLEGLREFCGPRLSKYKVPSRLQVVSDIPKNAMGKINKKGLVKLFD